jgi:hypothetical protein
MMAAMTAGFFSGTAGDAMLKCGEKMWFQSEESNTWRHSAVPQETAES